MTDDLRARAVHLIDDNPHYSAATALALRARGFLVRCFDSGESFLEQWTPADRGVVLLDRVMSERMLSGDQTGRALRQRRCAMPILYVTGERFKVEELMELAKSAPEAIVLDKHEDGPDFAKLSAAIQAALQVELRLRAEAERDQVWRQCVLADLTPTEREVLCGVVKRQESRQIADETDISLSVVEVHRTTINRKLREAGLSRELAMEALPQVLAATPGAHDLNDVAAIEFGFRVRWMGEPQRQELARLASAERVAMSPVLAAALGVIPSGSRRPRGAVRDVCRWLLNDWARRNRHREGDEQHLGDVWRTCSLIAGFKDDPHAASEG